jgi:hypothetical protein
VGSSRRDRITTNSTAQAPVFVVDPADAPPLRSV